MKKEYISPTADVIKLLRSLTVLAHFSADTDFLDYGEMPEEEVTVTSN